MTLYLPSRPMFRPARQSNGAIATGDRRTFGAIDRRRALHAGLSLGALTTLTGCDVTNSAAAQRMLKAVSSWNDRAQAALFDPNKLAPTFSEADVVKPPRFNAFYQVEMVKPVDVANWKLELSGLIKDKRPWTIGEIYDLPEQELIIRHVCVEGWDYIGQWSGPNLRDFLTRVGADLTAKYVAFRCADHYSSSIDMPSALHPQSILATKYARDLITDPFGAPLRLRTAVKIGFKNPKWITVIEVTNTYPGGYWEDRTYNWFSGI